MTIASDVTGGEYSREAYEAIVRAALADYRFGSFMDPRAVEPVIYLRHDVDYSLDVAVDLARINNALGVSATFFVLLRSEAYNVLSPASSRSVHQLNELGQHVGMHFTPVQPVADPRRLEDLVSSDYEVLSRNFPFMLPCFAWHNPTAELLNEQRELSIGGLLNVYSPKFMTGMSYFSDSNFRNSAEDLLAAVKSRVPRLQLLLHPLNWICGGGDTMTVLSRAWPRLLRSCERELMFNVVYKKRFPAGMPDRVVETLTDALTTELQVQE